jgi:hemerythrin-like domain-containing protein
MSAFRIEGPSSFGLRGRTHAMEVDPPAIEAPRKRVLPATFRCTAGRKDMSSPARKPERFLHFHTPAGYDDPIGLLLGCHRRIEKKLSTLENLRAHVARKGVDAVASGAAQGVLRYFDAPARYHHDDEEIDLLPLLERRIESEDERARLEDVARRIREDHEEMGRIWTRLRRPLEGIAEGFLRTIPETDVQALAALYKRHIEAEEGIIVPLAKQWLETADLMTLGQAMATRRGASFQGNARNLPG